jgi:uncharacterized membrane protein YhaH (DUF805 family)
MFNFAFSGKAQRGEYWRIYLSWLGATILAIIIPISIAFGSESSFNNHNGNSIVGLMGGMLHWG